MFCIHCKKEVNHAEVREDNGYTEDVFRKEFELGRFVNEQRVSLNKLIICSNKKCKYNVDGRCWNANYSYDCRYRPTRKEMTKNEVL